MDKFAFLFLIGSIVLLIYTLWDIIKDDFLEYIVVNLLLSILYIICAIISFLFLYKLSPWFLILSIPIYGIILFIGSLKAILVLSTKKQFKNIAKIIKIQKITSSDSPTATPVIICQSDNREYYQINEHHYSAIVELPPKKYRFYKGIRISPLELAYLTKYNDTNLALYLARKHNERKESCYKSKDKWSKINEYFKKNSEPLFESWLKMSDPNAWARHLDRKRAYEEISANLIDYPIIRDKEINHYKDMTVEHWCEEVDKLIAKGLFKVDKKEYIKEKGEIKLFYGDAKSFILWILVLCVSLAMIMPFISLVCATKK